MLLPTFTSQADPLTRILARDWHDDIINFVRADLPRLVAILVLALVLQRIVAFFVNRMRRLADRQAGNSQRASQLRTMATIVRATSYSIIGFIVLLHILSIFNINLTPLLASAGVVGVGIGLGAQSIFKDMLNGIFILVEDQYNVGEVVRIAGLSGTVEDLTLRLTRLRDGDGTLHIIPNSQIATVSNLSRDYSVASLPVSVDASADPTTSWLSSARLATELRNDPAFKDVIISDPDILGVDKINGREVIYPVNIRVRANQRDGVLRELRRRIIQTFEREGIPLGNDLQHAHHAAARPHRPARASVHRRLTGPPQKSGSPLRCRRDDASASPTAFIRREQIFHRRHRRLAPLAAAHHRKAPLLPQLRQMRQASAQAPAADAVICSRRSRTTLLFIANRASATASSRSAAASSPITHTCTGRCSIRCSASP